MTVAWLPATAIHFISNLNCIPLCPSISEPLASSGLSVTFCIHSSSKTQSSSFKPPQLFCSYFYIEKHPVSVQSPAAFHCSSKGKTSHQGRSWERPKATSKTKLNLTDWKNELPRQSSIEKGKNSGGEMTDKLKTSSFRRPGKLSKEDAHWLMKETDIKTDFKDISKKSRWQLLLQIWSEVWITYCLWMQFMIQINLCTGCHDEFVSVGHKGNETMVMARKHTHTHSETAQQTQ